jgi:hypothetical protein
VDKENTSLILFVKLNGIRERVKMDIIYFLKKQVLPLTIVSLLVSLTLQTTAMAYTDNTNYTPEEVRQINKETIAREQAERLRKKQLLILKHQKHLAQTRGQQGYIRPAQWQQSQGSYKAHRVSRPQSSTPAWRRSAGHIATRGADDAILTAAKARNLALIKQLVAEGADIRYKNFSGESALHIAASLGNIQMVQYLLSKGENINTKTIKNWLPIHHAIRFGHPVVANYLIGRRASLGFKNSDGFSALDFATRSKNMRIKAISRRYGR